ncbi:MAG: maleylpyruvate isomerase family mycothiol-dependent enzyme [Acidimicrobiales bacterium]
MEVSDYIKYVASEGDLFAAAAEKGDLNVDVPPCEGWDMRELVRHLGLIHLWAAANIEYPSDDWLDVDDLKVLAEYWPELASSWPEDFELVSWYRRTNENLVRVLDATPSDHQCFTFLPAPTPLTMWSRRQASEIAVHRFDAEVSRGITSQYEPEFAADMLDELLAGFGPLSRVTLVPSEQLLLVHAHDVDESWYLTFDPNGMKTSREGGDADVTVAGTASDLYLRFWNRTDDSKVSVTGDTGLLDLWRDHCRVRWSGA